MKIKVKSLVSSLVVMVAVLVASTLGMAAPASAAPANAWELRVCSGPFYRTLASWHGAYLDVPKGGCYSYWWQPWGPNPSLVIDVEIYAGARYVGTYKADIVRGTGLIAGGTVESPYVRYL